MIVINNCIEAFKARGPDDPMKKKKECCADQNFVPPAKIIIIMDKK